MVIRFRHPILKVFDRPPQSVPQGLEIRRRRPIDILNAPDVSFHGGAVGYPCRVPLEIRQPGIAGQQCEGREI